MIFIQLACTWIHPNDVRLPSLEDLHPDPENLIMVTVPMKWNLSPTPPDKKQQNISARYIALLICHDSPGMRWIAKRNITSEALLYVLLALLRDISVWEDKAGRAHKQKKKVLLTWLRWISRVTDGNVNARVVNLSYRKLSIDEVGMKIKTVWFDLKCEMGEKFTVNGID